MVIKRTRISNASFSSQAGAMGEGDRGAYNILPFDSGNPYNSNDYVFRWRQYVQLYETSWEARKIVRIIPEDALRKPWEAQDIPEEMAKRIKARLDQLRFHDILKRCLMLERLLGGCLGFVGVDQDKDETETILHPSKMSGKVRFINSIPVSRISRISWCTDPLSEHYMRPEKFLVNGNPVHVSRALVFDGEPLFDPYDFALTNFRSNLAGFGPSKLAAVWDDIVKAVGTRQAAYQLIQTNNAIIAAVSGLADLQGAKTGREALSKVKEIANQLSVYRAAIIDENKVDIKQHSASFGSVPELILTFIQILSAASDIPATRFIGQAPGGLNATGESDLENYYNVIDAYQAQRVEPAVRRMYDLVGYPLFKEKWHKVRESLTFKFPPLWNTSELEESQIATARIANAMTLVDAGLMDESKAIEEINAKGCLSVDLDETDIDLTNDTGEEEEGTPPTTPSAAPSPAPHKPGGALQEIQKLRHSIYVRNADKTSLLIKAAGGDPDKVQTDQFIEGFKDEQEHLDTVKGDQVTVAKIVLDHLAENPDYYREKVENSNDHKAIFGSLSMTQAKELLGDDAGAVTPAKVEQFKQWLKEQPYSNKDNFDEGKVKRDEGGQFSKQAGGKATKEKSKKEKPADKETKTADAWEKAMEGKSQEQREAFETARNRGIRVPPGWSNVWVNSDASADVQVKGKDAKGRMQSIYSTNARTKADAEKFSRVRAFIKEFPKLKEKIETDMTTKPEAQVLYLISQTGFRVGSDTDTGAETKAYGASNLTSEHVTVNGDAVSFSFTGKKGVSQKHTITDPDLARIVEGKEGRLFDTNDGKVRAYLKSINDKGFKVKDFRTYVATDTARQEIKKNTPPLPPKTAKDKAKAVMEIAKKVAQKLGNTPAMARDSYIDPAVFKQWEVAA